MARSMPRVRFTPHLQRFFPDLEATSVDGASVAAVIAACEARHPGRRAYLLDDRGALRKHENVFVDGARVKDRAALSDPVADGAEVFVLQALSGG